MNLKGCHAVDISLQETPAVSYALLKRYATMITSDQQREDAKQQRLVRDEARRRRWDPVRLGLQPKPQLNPSLATAGGSLDPGLMSASASDTGHKAL